MLPNGITGFRNLKDPYIPEQEKRIFQRFCYSIATRYHCEVLSFDLDLASKNFYSAEIKTEQGRFYLLKKQAIKMPANVFWKMPIIHGLHLQKTWTLQRLNL